MSRSLSLVTDAAEVAAIADAIAAADVFAFDIEFLSADRYIPELCLLQLAWPDAEPVAVDPLAVDITPLLERIADPSLLTVGHSAKQDLQLLRERHQCRAEGFVDTQIAAAFSGVGEQMGLARMIEALCGVTLDKGPQFTDWSKRPLSERQLRYALDDVRYLLPAWKELERRLGELGRRDWVEVESAALAAQCAELTPADEIYRQVSGAGAVKGKALGALRALAAWRERTARAENKPPSWLIPDQAMVEAARRGVKSPADLKRLRGVGVGTVRGYGDQIVAALARGAKEAPPAAPSKEPLSNEQQVVASVLSSAVQAECRRAALAPRFVGARAEVEELVRWFFDGADEATSGELKLLSSWRREVVGNDALAWLRGERAVVADAEHGVRLVGR